MNEETLKNYMEQNEQRLQRLEDNLVGKPGKSKIPAEDTKEKELTDFIDLMKAINKTPEPGPEKEGEDSFIQKIKDINK